MAIAFFPSSTLHHHLVIPINPSFTNPSKIRLDLNNRANHSIPANRASNFLVAVWHKPNSGLCFSVQERLRRKLFSTNSDKSPEERSTDEVEEEYDLGVKAALSVLRFYKSEISPILPRSCRFVPTCSEYSMIAYRKYGFAKGSILTAWRICRCNPLSGGSGFDPPRWFDEERPSED